MVAFSADYAGNTDVYVVPVSGGEPQRLTWHPGATRCRAGRPTARRSCSHRPAELGAEGDATVLDRAVKGGIAEPMPLPRGYQGKISPTAGASPIA
jgi:tricorn protease